MVLEAVSPSMAANVSEAQSSKRQSDDFEADLRGGDDKRRRSSSRPKDKENANARGASVAPPSPTAESASEAEAGLEAEVEEDLEAEAEAEEQEEAEAEVESEEEAEEDNLMHDDSASVESPHNPSIKPPEAGIIQKIYVENFMCHRKLTVDLCRNVNFICGQNGSGKSAILAAIQICLGAGARRTSRARNLKELVRKDGNHSFAKIRVTLLNKGHDGYQHDVYGDTITVERTISLRSGYNGYKLFDHNDKEQSRAKKDLDDMLDKLNIQVENPVAILDQEEAKKFLTGKAEDKYKFFMKATELERIDNTYSSTCDRVSELHKQLEKMQQNMEGDLDLLAEAQHNYQQFLAIDKLEKKLKTQQEGLAWAEYKEQRENLDELLASAEAMKARILKKTGELTQAEAATQDTNDEEAARRRNLNELTAEAETQSKLKTELEKDLKKIREPQKGLERQLKASLQDKKRAESNLAKANQRLKERRNDIIAISGSAESEAAKRAQELQDAEAKKAAKIDLINPLKQAVSESLRAYEEMEAEVENAKENVKQGNYRLKGMENRIRSLQNSSSSSVAVYGQKCATVQNLVKAAEKKNQFNGRVVGPIGSYIKIAAGKEEFAKLAESTLGHGVLDRWIVCNDHDRKVFQSIRRKAGCRQECGVFQQSPHARYNIPKPPAADIETVATVLNIANDTVFNTLVDNCKIDSRALSRSKEHSERQLLVTAANGRHSIRGNITNVYFYPSGDNWQVSRDGNLNIISNDKRNGLKQTIDTDTTAALAAAKTELEAMQKEFQPLKREESRLELEHHNIQKRWNQKKKELATVDKSVKELERDIDNFKIENENAATFDTDMSEQEDDVAEAEQVLNQQKEQEAAFREQIEENKPEINQVQDRLQETAARNEKVLSDLKTAEDDLSHYMQSLTQREEKLERRREKLKLFQKQADQFEEAVTAAQQEVDSALNTSRLLAWARLSSTPKEGGGEGTPEGAEEEEQPKEPVDEAEPTQEELDAIEPIPVDKNAEHFAKKIESIKKKIQREKVERNATKGDKKEAFQKYLRAQTVVEQKQQKTEQIQDTCKNLEADMQERRKRWKLFRSHVARSSDTRFNEILNRKGSSGTVEYNHRDQELTLIVQKDASDANSQQKDLKALSGGERSFTTIALLLALGESLETPFRVLDEFDVFLDPVTRKLTIEQLISTAKEMPHRQFIFITPQDVSNVETDPMLKVLKMKNPNRRSVAGGPEQQTLDFS